MYISNLISKAKKLVYICAVSLPRPMYKLNWEHSRLPLWSYHNLRLTDGYGPFVNLFANMYMYFKCWEKQKYINGTKGEEKWVQNVTSGTANSCLIVHQFNRGCWPQGMATRRAVKSAPITCMPRVCVTHVIESNTGSSKSLDWVALVEATERCYW